MILYLSAFFETPTTLTKTIVFESKITSSRTNFLPKTTSYEMMITSAKTTSIPSATTDGGIKIVLKLD